MTLTEFKFLLQPGGLLDSSDRKVNIAYTGSRIESIAVRIENNNLIQLQQATAIILKAPEAGTTLNISLENSQVPIRTVNREQVGNYYLYSFVEQSQQPVMTAIPSPTGTPALEQYFTEVVLLPSVEDGIFQGSVYDTLVNNSMNNRLSTYIQISDRSQTLGNTTNPVNLPSILIENALPASIQDSNYSNTGWKNGRYDGSITTGNTFGQIDPVIGGRLFEGEEYSIQALDSDILNLPDSERIYREYIHSSRDDLPQYRVNEVLYALDEPVSESDTIITIEGVAGLPPPAISVGNVIIPRGYSEKMKVTSISRVVGPLNQYQLQVIRGWDNTIPLAYGVEPFIEVIEPVTIIRVENSRAVVLGKSKVYLKESQTILRLDTLGQIVSGSIT